MQYLHPHISDVKSNQIKSNQFDLISDVTGVLVLTLCVCPSVCPPVRLSHYPSQTNRHTDLNIGLNVKWKDI